MSGLIALLVAAQILNDGGSQEASTHRIVYAALDGESWGYMGSKRMIWELSEGKEFLNSTRRIPLDLNDVEKVCTMFYNLMDIYHMLYRLLEYRSVHRECEYIVKPFLLG